MTTEDAIKHFGTATAVADALDISKVAVSQWGVHPPRLRQLELETLTKGVLKAEPKPKAA